MTEIKNINSQLLQEVLPAYGTDPMSLINIYL